MTEYEIDERIKRFHCRLLDSKENSVYGSWYVVKRLPEPRRYLCLCVCGKSKSLDIRTLEDGRSRSCGCQRRKGRGGGRSIEQVILPPEMDGEPDGVIQCPDDEDESYE